jgi:tRNA1(Val) A37 N6-methylase TrmN6
LFLYQEESGFLFNSDSHFLFDFISKFQPTGKLLDIGCGCGILGLLCARDFKITLHSIDSQPHNITLTKENARVNHLCVTTHQGNFLSHPFDEKFDFIISNPPYYHDGVTKSDNDILHISRYNNHLPLKSMIQRVNQLITPRGHFIFCYDAKQLQEILTLCSTYKLPIEDIRFLHGRDKKTASLVMIHARKGSNALTKIDPPLIHFQNGSLSQEAEDIYKKTRTYSIKCKIV